MWFIWYSTTSDRRQSGIRKPSGSSNVEYTITEGAAQKWDKLAAGVIEIRAKRNENDETSLLHFVTLQIDGKAMIRGFDYTTREGSVIVTLKPSVMESLTNGIHRITFIYDDGKVETTLTIIGNSETTPSGNTSGNTSRNNKGDSNSGSNSGNSSSSSSSSNSNSSTNPSTGDIFGNPFLWFGGMLLVIFLLRLFIKSREQRIQEALDMQSRKY